MRYRVVHQVEINIDDYENSIKLYDQMLERLGYSSSDTLGIDYQSIFYYAFPQSYIGMLPAKSNVVITLRMVNRSDILRQSRQ